MERDKIAQLVYKWFKGRHDVYAVHDPFWRPIRVHHNWHLVTRPHLEGSKAHGFYQLTDLGVVYCSCIDIDFHGKNQAWKRESEAVCQVLHDYNLEPLAEISQSGQGCHLWIFHPDGAPATLVRRFWYHILDRAGVSLSTEVFPRQAALEKKQIGNLIRYPLWGKSHFVDILDDWEPLTAQEALEGIVATDQEDLERLAPKAKEGHVGQPGAPEDMVLDDSGLTGCLKQMFENGSLEATKRWKGSTKGLEDKSPSAVFRSFLIHLIQYGLPDWEAATAGHAWCKKHNRPNLSARMDREVASARDYVRAQTLQQGRRTKESQGPHALLSAKTSLMEAEQKEVEWLWENRIPLGSITLLAGRSGSYKTWFALECARMVSGVGLWPDGTEAPEGEVWFFTSEDSASTIRYRADLLGANLNKISLFDTSETPASFSTISQALELPEAEGVKLVVVDPADGHLGDGGDTNDAIDTRDQLTDIKPVLEQKGMCLLVIHHRNKRSEGHGHELVAGSRAWVNVPRTVIQLSKDPDSQLVPKVTLEWIKCNVSPRDPTTLVAMFEDGFKWICDDKKGWDAQ